MRRPFAADKSPESMSPAERNEVQQWLVEQWLIKKGLEPSGPDSDAIPRQVAVWRLNRTVHQGRRVKYLGLVFSCDAAALAGRLAAHRSRYGRTDLVVGSWPGSPPSLNATNRWEKRAAVIVRARADDRP